MSFLSLTRLTVVLVLILAATLPLPITTAQAISTYKLPFPSGQGYSLTQAAGQGDHQDLSKYAVDFAQGDTSFLVIAARGGTVVGARGDSTASCQNVSCWTDANFVLIDHGDDATAALYLHLATGTVQVKQGDTVVQGQQLANAGHTGWVIPGPRLQGNHLHFEVEATPSCVLPAPNPARNCTTAGWWWEQSNDITLTYLDSAHGTSHEALLSTLKRGSYWSDNTVSTPNPNTVPGGTWISPADGSTMASFPFHFAAHAYPSNPGDPPIDHVNFTVWWPAQGPEFGPWQPACSVQSSAAQGDVYGCDWSLQATPSGPMKVSFDVYDQVGNRNAAPNGDRTLTFSPTSSLPSTIAYISSAADLWVAATDGSSGQKIVDGPVARPAWSYDGRHIAYLRLAHASNPTDLYGDQIEIANADGTAETVVVPPKKNSLAPPQGEALLRVRWAPDNRSIYYQWNFGNISGKGVIEHDLTTGAEKDLGIYAFDFDVAKDGAITYWFSTSAGSEVGDNLYVLMPNGEKHLLLRNPATGVRAPAWSPDGTRIATGPGVAVVNRDGTGGRTILHVNFQEPVSTLTWASDGNTLIYEQGASVWTIPVTGGTPKKLFAGKDPASQLVLSPQEGVSTPSVTPTIVPTATAPAAFIFSPLQRTVIGHTIEAQVTSIIGARHVQLSNGTNVYLVPSANPPAADRIIISNGVVVFESTFSDAASGYPKFSYFKQLFGTPDEQIPGSRSFGGLATTYVYNTKGFALVGNQSRDEIYEIQRFVPLSVSEYRSRYGCNITTGSTYFEC